MGILNIWQILLASCEWDLEWGHELFIEYICSTRRLDLSGKEVRNCPFFFKVSSNKLSSHPWSKNDQC